MTKTRDLNIILGVEYGVVFVLELNVSRLKRSPGDSVRFDLAASLPPLEIAEEVIHFTGPVKADLVVNNTGTMLRVTGEVSGSLKLTCGRCLESFQYDFEVPLEEIYTPLPESEMGEAILFSGDTIDVTPEIIKSVILTLPMRAVCNEECQGLCPECGFNLNEGSCGCNKEVLDPRLRVLKEFFEKNDQEDKPE